MTKKALTLIIAAAVALIGLSLLCSGEAVAFADPSPFRLYAFVNKECESISPKRKASKSR